MYRNNLRETVEHLSLTIGPRAPGSDAEATAAEYLKRRFAGLGLPAEIETFASASHGAIRSTLRAESGEVFPSLPTQFTAGGRAEGALVYLGTGKKVPVGCGDLDGKVGLICPEGSHAEKIDYLLGFERAGLAGLIVVSPYLDNIMTKIVRYPEIERLPMAAVSWRSGTALKRLEGGKVTLDVESEAPGKRQSYNVVATLRGTGPYWVAVTSHMDSAAFAPGAMDNASGVAVMLEAARSLAGKPLPASVVFVATGSEEYGQRDGTGAGAQAFFDSRADDLERCIAHVEIDDVGNVLGMPKVYTGGSGVLRDAVLGIETDLDYVYKGRHDFVGCDHGAAEQRGVPYVWMIDAGQIGLAAWPPTYHSPLDTVECMDYALAARYVDFMRDVIAMLAERKPFYPTLREGGRLIRPARHADIPAILEITRLAFEPVSVDKKREVYFGGPLGGKPWHDHKGGPLRQWLTANIYAAIVCETDGKVVGYATYMLDETRGLAEIGNNAVHPDYQRRGIGKAMQAEVQRRMVEDGYEKFAVSTLSVDVPAQKVYEKLGYEKIAETWHYCRKAKP